MGELMAKIITINKQTGKSEVLDKAEIIEKDQVQGAAERRGKRELDRAKAQMKQVLIFLAENQDYTLSGLAAEVAEEYLTQKFGNPARGISEPPVPETTKDGKPRRLTYKERLKLSKEDQVEQTRLWEWIAPGDTVQLKLGEDQELKTYVMDDYARAWPFTENGSCEVCSQPKDGDPCSHVKYMDSQAEKAGAIETNLQCQHQAVCIESGQCCRQEGPPCPGSGSGDQKEPDPGLVDDVFGVTDIER